MADLLFLDPATGERFDYADLRRSVSEEWVDHAPCLRPASPGAAVLGLLRALLLGQELTLLDSDFGSGELAALGVDETRLAEGRRVRGLDAGEAADLAVAARRPAAEGFRLTLFTSGSTGRPKRVTHGLAGLTRALRTGPRHAASVWGLAYNPTHIAGVQVILQAFFNRNPLIHLFQAAPGAVAQALVAHGVTHLSATPSFYRLLLPAAAACPGLRSVTVGGERSDPSLLAALAEKFPAARRRNLYASTEAGTLLEAEGDLFSIPAALAERVRIREGQLEVHASLLGGFAGAGTGEGAERGADREWFRTGDLVEPSPEDPARFRIVSRESERVNVGGHKVDVGEVEAALLACPGVREARVYGRPNSVLGQLLCAEVVTGDGFDEVALREQLAGRLQAVKVPRLIKRVDNLERTRSGKVSRT